LDRQAASVITGADNWGSGLSPKNGDALDSKNGDALDSG
jgi:hypothetical protein